MLEFKTKLYNIQVKFVYNNYTVMQNVYHNKERGENSDLISETVLKI